MSAGVIGSPAMRWSWSPTNIRRSAWARRSGIRQAHILEANLAARDKPPVLASKARLPELLGRTLMNGFGHEG